MIVSRGDVVLVDFPYSDGTGSKVRPALVVQADSLNQRRADTILVSISKSQRHALPTQLFIGVSTPEGIASGVRCDSSIQCENLLTLEQEQIVAKIGRLPDPQMDCIDACLEAALGLT